MLVIITILIIVSLIYFPSKLTIKREENLGKRHLENLDKIDPFEREVINRWVAELYEEIGKDKLVDETLHRLIGLKIAQSRNSGELGERFKELPKSVDEERTPNK